MRLFATLAMILLTAAPSFAETIEDFSGDPARRWAFFTDQVMGGVSTGGVSVSGDGLRLTGTVSTANNGGFIQARLKLSEPLPQAATAIRLRVKGDGQRYFVHIRTRGTILPWQFYQAPFETTGAWREVRLPLHSFKPYARMRQAPPRAETVRSIAIVAYGRDHTADVSVNWIGYD